MKIGRGSNNHSIFDDYLNPALHSLLMADWGAAVLAEGGICFHHGATLSAKMSGLNWLSIIDRGRHLLRRRNLLVRIGLRRLRFIRRFLVQDNSKGDSRDTTKYNEQNEKIEYPKAHRKSAPHVAKDDGCRDFIAAPQAPPSAQHPSTLHYFLGRGSKSLGNGAWQAGVFGV